MNAHTLARSGMIGHSLTIVLTMVRRVTTRNHWRSITRIETGQNGPITTLLPTLA